jgi:peptide methionine sulfoxide reductase msrA/msrB
MKTIYLAGGCFWGTEKYLGMIPGVVRTETGYANGRTENPTYEEVCRHTGHAETVRVEYDEGLIALEELLDLFYDAIDPTSLNRQGMDEGIQYRTGVYYTDDTDLSTIRASLAALQIRCDKPLAIETRPLENYSGAEEYHQKYLDKNPSGYCHIGQSTMKRLQTRLGGKKMRKFSKKSRKSGLCSLTFP